MNKKPIEYIKECLMVPPSERTESQRIVKNHKKKRLNLTLLGNLQQNSAAKKHGRFFFFNFNF